jgi:ATP-dependent Clp endopeptidase proteolytic subunit ClpP
MRNFVGMEGTIFINGQIGTTETQKGVELIDIIQQVKAQPEALSFRVHINSEGGVVDTGFDIFNYIKSLRLPITTVGSGLVASIATVVFMAGDKRILTTGTEFMIHSPMGGIDGTADQIEEYAQSVRDCENRLIKFYSQQTGLSADALQPLLKNETWLTEDQATSLGFATLLNEPILAKAYLNLNNDKPMTKEDKSWIEEKFTSILNSFKKKVVNIILQDANGVSIDFAEVAEGETPELGAMATVDGQPAEGEYIMPDGSTFVFSAGALQEIRVVEEDSAMKEIDELKRQLAEKEAALQASATTISEQEAQITNIVKEVKELKAGITSRFNGEEKKENKKDEVITNSALSALENLKTKRRK